MASFTRVELPPGPERDLLDVLTDLHIKAGEPTAKEISTKIKKLSAQSAISTDTVWRVMCGKQLAKWKYVERIVEALDGQPDALRPVFDAARTVAVAPHRRAASEKGTAAAEPSKATPPAPAPSARSAHRSEAGTEVERKARGVVDRNLRTLKVMAPDWEGRPTLVREIGASIIDVWQATEPPLRPRLTMPFAEAFVEHLTSRDICEIVTHFHTRGHYDLALQITGVFARMGEVSDIKASIPWFTRFNRNLLDTLLKTVARARTGDIVGFQDIDAGSFTILMDHVAQTHALRAGHAGPSLITSGYGGRRVLPALPPRMALGQSGTQPDPP